MQNFDLLCFFAATLDLAVIPPGVQGIFFLLALEPNSGLGHLHETFRFTLVTISRTVGRTPWTGDQFVARPLPVHKHRKSNTEHKH
jgi:ABC-type molybdate transport system permease subunit